MSSTSTDPLDDWSLPDHLSDEARSTFRDLLVERPDLTGADGAAALAACEFLSIAEALDAEARAAGLVAIGSRRQPIVHPAIIEARLQRHEAAAILARLAPSTAARRAAAAQKANGARWASTR